MKTANNLPGMMKSVIAYDYPGRNTASCSIRSACRQPVFLKAFVLAVTAAAFIFTFTGCSPPACTFPPAPPALTASTGSQRSAAVLNSCVWPSTGSSNTGLSKIEEPRPPVLPIYPLFLMPEEPITFLIQSFKIKPESVNIQVFNTGTSGVAGELTEPVASTSLKDFEICDDGVSWSWALPRLEPMPAEEPQRALRIEVTWPQLKKPSAVYYVSLSYAESGSVQEACDKVMSGFLKGHDGSQENLLALLPETVKPEYQDLNSYSFELLSEPETRVRSFYPSNEEPPHADIIYSEIHLVYSIKSTHKATGQSARWDFCDLYTLKHKDNEWQVIWIAKNSTPWAFDGGKEPGWEIALEQTALPGGGTISKIGPFTWVRYYDSMFLSDDGRYLAFAADNFSKKEIWIASRDGAALERVLSFPVAENAAQWSETLRIIGWAPAHSDTGASPQHKVRFIYSGYQTAGPHMGGSGCWIGEIDCNSGEIRDVAFISGSWMFEPKDIVVSADRQNVVLHRSSNLWKVSLDTRKVDLLASDLPSWDWMFTLKTSPSGSYGAYKDLSKPNSPVIVYNLESGDKLTVPIANPGESMSSFLLRWAPEDLLVVSIARDGDVVEGEGLSYPAGSVELRYYDVQGNMKFRLTSPSEVLDDKIVQWAWPGNNDFVVFTLGPVLEETACSCYEHNCIQYANSLWAAQIPKNPEGQETAGQVPGQLVNLEAKYVGPLAGRIHEIKLSADLISKPAAGSAAGSNISPPADSTAAIDIKVWYFPSPDSYDYGDVIWQDGTGFSISPKSGEKISGPEHIQRPNPFDLESEATIGVIGSTTYLKRQSEAANRILHQIYKKTPAGEEAVVWEGEAYIPDVRLISETLVFQAYETQGGAESLDKNYLYIIDPGAR